jgi:hypothetical protein
MPSSRACTRARFELIASGMEISSERCKKLLFLRSNTRDRGIAARAQR